MSPQGWDYVFLIATPAVMLIVDRPAGLLPRGLRLATIAAIAVVALSIYDLMGREAYAAFMASSVITLCFLVEIAALVALRFRGARGDRMSHAARSPADAAALACALDRQASRATPRLPDPDAGVSETLARERAHRVSNVRYDVALAIPADRQLPIAGTHHRDVHARRCGRAAGLRLRARSCRAASRVSAAATEPVRIRQVNGHVIVPREALQAGENRLTFTIQRRQRLAQSQRRFPLHDLRAGQRAPGASRVSISRI